MGKNQPVQLTYEQLVERVMWGIHASHELPSPRQAWCEMAEDERAVLRAAAEGAISAYKRYAPEAEQQP